MTATGGFVAGTIKRKPTALAEVTHSNLHLVEAVEGDDTRRLVGDVAQVNVVNANRRFYSGEVFQEALQRVAPDVERGAFTGELDHPSWDASAYGSLERTAMVFDRLFMEGDLVKFEARLLNTPAGRTLEALLEQGVHVGMSTRGFATIVWRGEDEETEVGYVQDDFQLLGVDAVKMPSNPAGVVRLRESIEARIPTPPGKDEPVDKIETVEELTAAYPQLVEAIRGEGASKLEEANAAATAERAELEDRITNLESQLAEARKQLDNIRVTVIGEQEEEPVEGDTSVAVKALMESMSELRKELEATQARAATAERVSTLREHFDGVCAKHAHGDILRGEVDPAKFESVEAIDAEVARLGKLIERVNASHGAPKGKGVLEREDDTIEADPENTFINETSLAFIEDLIKEPNHE